MPIPIIAETIRRGPEVLTPLKPVLQAVLCLLLIAAAKYLFGGARNHIERKLHGKVVMVTGGTSGIGSAAVRELALRGAQIVLLTQQPPSDPFVAEYVEDLRNETGNELIYAEHVDLASLHSIRSFATKWIDNVPPRRLDMILLCASTLTPRNAPPSVTHDGLEACWGVNYVANFHLLSILSPAIRVQPPDRDVRIVIATCSSYTKGLLRAMKDSTSPIPPGSEFSTSKLALMVFGKSFQAHLDKFVRPDKQANNARVVMVDPGLSRTPGTRRWLSMGSLWGLLWYLLAWPLLWLVLKSPEQGAQTFLTATMDLELRRRSGGRLLRECKEVQFQSKEIENDVVAEKLWVFTEKQIAACEKEGAKRRLREREQEDSKAKDAGKGSEIDNSEAAAVSTATQDSRRSRSKRRLC